MKQRFDTYYLRWFIIFSFAFGLLFLTVLVRAIFQGSEAFVYLGKGVLYCFAVIVTLTLLCGGCFHFWDEYVWPKRRLNILKELEQLETLQFQRDEQECCYGGMYKEFYLVVSPYPVLGEGCNLKLFAFIAPVEENIRDLENLIEGYQLMLTESAMCIERVLSTADKTIPSFQQLIHEMDKMVNYLKLKDIKPAQVEIEEITNR